MEGLDASHIRFDVRELVGLDLARCKSVRPPAIHECLVPSELLASCDDDELPAELVWNRMLVGEGDQCCATLTAEPRFQGSGYVVEPRVQNARVVAALMRRELRFLLDDCHAGVGSLLQQAHRGGETDEPRADDDEIELVHYEAILLAATAAWP